MRQHFSLRLVLGISELLTVRRKDISTGIKSSGDEAPVKRGAATA
jgi:hypothetical protein